MASQNYGIFPASGGLGGSTLKHILDLVDPSKLTIVVRKPETVPAKATESGVTVRAADFDNAPTLEHAFDGISTLNLISYASIQHEHRSKVHKLAIDAARKSGVSHIFYSSLAFGGDCEGSSLAHVMQAHLDTEKYLASLAASDPSFTYTAVRIGIYSESFPIYTAFFNPAAPLDEVKIPHDGSGPGIAWAKRDELGEAMARLISQYVAAPESFPYVNRTVLLSGPKVWSLSETVQLLGKVAKKQVKLREVSVEEYAKQPQVQSGLSYGSGDYATIWADAFKAIKKGETAVVSPLLAQVLGREPEPFEKTLENMF